MRPAVVLGAGALAQADRHEQFASLLTTARELCINHIDTSPTHSDHQRTGNAERLSGLTLAAKKGFAINAEVDSDADGRCPLNRGQVWESVKSTLQRLDVDQVDILYIHAPASETLLEQQAAAMDDLYRQGKFKRLGVANFSLVMLQDYLAVCHRNNYLTPSVFAVAYNLIWRFPESKLLPFFRQYGIAIAARSPLAGGLLAGRFAPEQQQQQWQRTYDRPCFRAAAADLVALVSPHGVSPAEAALRWLCWHSRLGGGDGVVLGAAASTGQLSENMRGVERGPLPEALVVGIERIWETVQEAVRRR